MSDSDIEIRDILPEINSTCFVIPGLFTNLECAQILNSTIKDSFQQAISNYPTFYRNNDRLVVDHHELASELFSKVRKFLPETIETTSSIQTENGVWHLKELNNRLRYCKYSANQYFHRHLDGVHYQDTQTQSKLTFMIYLNGAEDFVGGRTLFYETKDTDRVLASYIPEKGDVIVFDHNVWHEGEVLEEGEKFVLRSDILYSNLDKVIENKPFSGHLGYIWSLVKLNNNTILSGGRDKSIKVWSTHGKLKKSLQAHQNSILCIEKINENAFMSGSRDQNIIIWQDFKLIRKIHIHTALILSLCCLSDNVFSSSSGDSTIKLFDIDGTVLKTLDEHTNWVWKVISLDNDVFASCSEDGSIKIWCVDNDHSINTFTEDESIISLAYNAETRQLISGNLQGELSIRTLTKSYQLKEITTFRAHNGIIRSIKVLDGNFIASAGEDNNAKIWDSRGVLKSEYQHHNFVQSMDVINPKTLLSASYDGTIKRWEIPKL